MHRYPRRPDVSESVIQSLGNLPVRTCAARGAPRGRRVPAALLRALRVALAAALIALVSGAPQAAFAALSNDCCAEECDGDREGAQCPPGCGGGCAKVLPFAVSAASRDSIVAAGAREEHALPSATPVLPLVLGAVFHPPRR